jgi:ankyrin repeat protein
MQLKPEELRNDVFFLKDDYNRTPWQNAAEGGKVEVLEKMWEWAKRLQLKPEELRYNEFSSKHNFNDTHCHMAAKNGNV